MGTLIKRKGLFPPRAKKSVNQFFYDFITSDFSDLTDKNFTALDNKPPSVHFKETDTSIEVEMKVPEMKREDLKVEMDNDAPMISSEEEVEKKGHFIEKKFNYRSFCRLPNP